MLNVSLGGQREGQDCFSLTETRAGTSVRRLEAQLVLVTFNKGLCQGGQDEEEKEGREQEHHHHLVSAEHRHRIWRSSLLGLQRGAAGLTYQVKMRRTRGVETDQVLELSAQPKEP